MPTRLNQEIKQMLFPYQFVLKEGPEFDKNFMNYSLLMLQINNEVISGQSGRNGQRVLTRRMDVIGTLPF